MPWSRLRIFPSPKRRILSRIEGTRTPRWLELFSVGADAGAKSPWYASARPERTTRPPELAHRGPGAGRWQESSSAGRTHLPVVGVRRAAGCGVVQPDHSVRPAAAVVHHARLARLGSDERVEPVPDW